jgi:hypothetical protein
LRVAHFSLLSCILDQVLALYAHRLHDPSQALRYCHQVYNEQVEEARHVYLSLLQVLLSPASTDFSADGSPMAASSSAMLSEPSAAANPVMLENVLQILTQYHDRIETAKVLFKCVFAAHPNFVEMVLLWCLSLTGVGITSSRHTRQSHSAVY